MARQKVFIGVPSGGSVHAKFMLALIQLLKYEWQEPSDKYEVIDVGNDQSIYIQENRNALVRRAKHHGADWLLQIDPDETFHPNLLRVLMATADAREKPIVAGVYSNLGKIGANNVEVLDCIYREMEDGKYMTITGYESTEPFRVDACGTGMFLTHMSVFEKIKYPWFWCDLFENVSIDGRPVAEDERFQFVNEDLGFCRTAREHGYDIWVEPKAEVIHWKTVPLSPSTTRAFMKKAWRTKEEMECASKAV